MSYNTEKKNYYENHYQKYHQNHIKIPTEKITVDIPFNTTVGKTVWVGGSTLNGGMWENYTPSQNPCIEAESWVFGGLYKEHACTLCKSERVIVSRFHVKDLYFCGYHCFKEYLFQKKGIFIPDL